MNAIEVAEDDEGTSPSGSPAHSFDLPSTSLSAGLKQPETFVAEDLEEKIRESARGPCRRSLSASFSSDKLLHPDPKILDDIELCARRLASGVDTHLRELRGSLHGMSDLVLETSQIYKASISSACDAADHDIKNTYAMMAKVEELNGSLRRVSKTAQQVKEMRKTIELFETLFHGSLT